MNASSKSERLWECFWRYWLVVLTVSSGVGAVGLIMNPAATRPLYEFTPFPLWFSQAFYIGVTAVGAWGYHSLCGLEIVEILRERETA